MKKIISTLVLLTGSQITFGQTVQQVRDIYPGTGSSNPSGLTSFNNMLLFSANDSVSGEELWISDGTASGTSLVKDINSGTVSSMPRSLVKSGGMAFFRCDDGMNGWELWKSDGTAAGTVMVNDIEPGSAGSMNAYWCNLADINGTLFFNPEVGGELWKSDGTAQGTAMIKDLYSGFSTGPTYSVSYLTEVNGTVFFSSPDDGINGKELWKSDGTAPGTVMVKDINPGASGGFPGGKSVAMNGKLFFRANDGTNGTELWVSDGTGPGTIALTAFPDTLTGNVSNFVDVNGTLFFSAPTVPKSLWKSDGTPSGTVVVKDGFTSIDNFFNVNGTLYFDAKDGVNGMELWKSDGTALGTVMIKDVNPGSGSSREYPAFSGAASNNLFYFTADDGTNGIEIWKTDGTAPNTVLVTSFQNDSIPWSEPRDFKVVNDSMLFFTVQDSASGRELWVLKDTPAVSGIPGENRPGRSALKISPNPFSNSATIEIREEKNYNLQLSVCNLLGEIVFQSAINASQTELQRGQLMPGIYFAQVRNENVIIAIQKFVIQ